MKKQEFHIGKNKDTDQLCKISAFVFGTQIVQIQFVFYLNPKFQASNLFL